jgi:hypothetical protein
MENQNFEKTGNMGSVITASTVNGAIKNYAIVIIGTISLYIHFSPLKFDFMGIYYITNSSNGRMRRIFL